MKKILLFLIISTLGFQVSATELYGLKIGATEQALHDVLPIHPKERLERPKRNITFLIFSQEDSLNLSHGESEEIEVGFCSNRLCNISSSFAIDIFSSEHPQYDKYVPIFDKKYTWLGDRDKYDTGNISSFYKSDDNIIELSRTRIAIIQKGHDKQINFYLPPDL